MRRRWDLRGGRSPRATRCRRAFAGKSRDGAVIFLAVDDDHRDIVLRAPLESEPDQRLASLLRRRLPDIVKDLVVIDMAGQAVTAQHEPIARAELPLHHFKCWIF